jgi:hypothetical protein
MDDDPGLAGSNASERGPCCSKLGREQELSRRRTSPTLRPRNLLRATVFVAVVAMLLSWQGDAGAQFSPPGTVGVSDYKMSWTVSITGTETTDSVNSSSTSQHTHSVTATWQGQAQFDVDAPHQVLSYTATGTYRIAEAWFHTWFCDSGPDQTSHNIDDAAWRLLPPNPAVSNLALEVFEQQPDGSLAVRAPFPYGGSWDTPRAELRAEADRLMMGHGADCYTSWNSSVNEHSDDTNWPPFGDCLAQDIPAVDSRTFRAYTQAPVYGEAFVETCFVEVVWIAGLLQLNMSVTPQSTRPTIRPNPLTPGKPTIPIAVTVQAARDGVPVAALPVTLTRLMDYRPGGHRLSHSNTPMLAPITLKTNAAGEVSFIVPAGEIAGVLYLHAHANDDAAPGGIVRSNARSVQIRVPNLARLTDTRYRHNVASHTGVGNYGHPLLLWMLRRTADNVDWVMDHSGYLRKTCASSMQPLVLNGMSLPWGGLFDIGKNFRPPHSWHRAGNDVDIRVITMPGQCRWLLLDSILAAAATTVPISLDFPPGEDDTTCSDPSTDVDGCHWHLQVGIEDPPPPSPQNLGSKSPVQVSVSQDKATGRFRYTYRIENNTSKPLDKIAIEFRDSPWNAKSPDGWVSMPFGDPGGLFWGAIAVDQKDNVSSHPSNVTDSIARASSAAITPKQALAGFSFEHEMPPQVAIVDLYTHRPLRHIGTRADFEQSSSFVAQTLTQRIFSIAPQDRRPITLPRLAADLEQTAERLCTLGWLRSCPTATSSFAAAMERLRASSHDREATRLSAEAIVQEIERLRQGSLLDENAYTILLFQTQDLIGRIHSAPDGPKPSAIDLLVSSRWSRTVGIAILLLIGIGLYLRSRSRRSDRRAFTQ